jgi:hypothetical protein
MKIIDSRYRLYRRFRLGRFQVSLFLMKHGSLDLLKACIRYNEFDEDSNSWKRRYIWCLPGELNDLSHALLYLREQGN